MNKLIALFLMLSLIFGVPYSTHASDLEEDKLREQIDSTNSQIEQIEKEIKKYQQQISKTSAESKTLANVIKELNLTRSKLLKEREQIEKKIKATSLVIKEISSDINDKEQSIQLSQNSLKKLIRSMYENDQNTILEYILSKNKISDISFDYNSSLSVNDELNNHINELRGKKNILSQTKNSKEEEQKKLDNLKTNLTLKQKVVESTKKEKDTLLTQTKNKEAEYQKLLAEQIKRRDAFEKELSDYESKLKFILNPNTLPKAGTVALSWPLDNVYITSLFGPRWGRIHLGLDFRASVGTSVKSTASGEVVGVGDTDEACPRASFGKWILIKHNNGLSTVYGHLSAISVKKGQKVSSGDIIGLSGNTGSSTGPHLHLGVFASAGVKVDKVPSKVCSEKVFVQPVAAQNAYLNPSLYLPSISKNSVKK
jgi:murein DD-endopeptidase MepM/ murein hydrolase activator NlpD